jgi:hypothetical protein
VPIGVPGRVRRFLRHSCGRWIGVAELARPLRFRQTEIEDFRLAALGDKDVRRLDVAMDNFLLMRRIERIGNLDRQFEQVGQFERLAGNPVLQRAPLEQLHREEPRPLVLADVIDRADIGMVQR